MRHRRAAHRRLAAAGVRPVPSSLRTFIFTNESTLGREARQGSWPGAARPTAALDAHRRKEASIPQAHFPSSSLKRASSGSSAGGGVSTDAPLCRVGSYLVTIQGGRGGGCLCNKILFDFEAFVHESIIRALPPPSCIARTIAILSHDYCAIHDAPHDLRFVGHTPYNIGNANIV